VESNISILCGFSDCYVSIYIHSKTLGPTLEISRTHYVYLVDGGYPSWDFCREHSPGLPYPSLASQLKFLRLGPLRLAAKRQLLSSCSASVASFVSCPQHPRATTPTTLFPARGRNTPHALYPHAKPHRRHLPLSISAVTRQAPSSVTGLGS
jgi:hypothetical protein